MKYMKYEQGFVLVIALVFLVALTGVASALMLNTTSDMKMSGASQEKVIAEQSGIGSIDEVILLQDSVGANNIFLKSVFPIEGTPVVVTAMHSTAIVSRVNNNSLDVDCPAMKAGDDVENTKCNRLKITVIKTYGNNNTSSIDVNAGILQQMKPIGG